MPHVLVVDDDRGTVDTFGAMLRLAGFDASTATSGREGLRLAQSGPCHVVLVDLRLPDMTGIDVLRALREMRADAQCVVMTAFGTVGSAVEAMKLGARDYIEKPLTEDDLLDVVRRAADGARDPSATPSATRVNSARVAGILGMIERRFYEPGLRLSAIARELGLSSEHSCRLLKQETGAGFMLHLHRTRVEAAKRLLRDTDLTVKEIAYRTGYANTSRLDHYFKRMCGVLPLAFRVTARWSDDPRKVKVAERA